MRHWLIGIALVLSTMALAACGGGGAANTPTGDGGDGGNASGLTADVESTTQNFVDALFKADFDAANGMAAPEYVDLVKERVALFAALLDKYEFQETKITTTRAWVDGSGNENSDKRVEVTFQFRDKTPDARWRIGSLNVRALIIEGDVWAIANLQLIRPES